VDRRLAGASGGKARLKLRAMQRRAGRELQLSRSCAERRALAGTSRPAPGKGAAAL